MNIDEMLLKSSEIMSGTIDVRAASAMLELIGCGHFPVDILAGLKLYSEYLPKASELGFTPEQRYLHFIWDALEKTPLAMAVNFAIPFRRMIAGKLFKKCGKNFIAEENVRFNFGQNIEIGDDVFMNRNVFLDSKAGITIGNGVALAENVDIFTHSHSESEHNIRTYAKVVIKDYAKIYSHSTILGGVTVGEQSIVAAKSLVSKDIADNAVVAGIPAKEIRTRKTEGRAGKQLMHIWLAGGAFQENV